LGCWGIGASDAGDGGAGAGLVSAANAWRLGLGWSAGFTAARSSSPRSGSRGGDAAVGGDCGEGEEVPGSAPIAEICGPGTGIGGFGRAASVGDGAGFESAN